MCQLGNELGLSAWGVASPPRGSLHVATWVSSPDGSCIPRGNIP